MRNPFFSAKINNSESKNHSLSTTCGITFVTILRETALNPHWASEKCTQKKNLIRKIYIFEVNVRSALLPYTRAPHAFREPIAKSNPRESACTMGGKCLRSVDKSTSIYAL